MAAPGSSPLDPSGSSPERPRAGASDRRDAEHGGRFAGRVVVVTGGGSGIGRAIAHAFVDEGAAVAVIGRRAEPLAATVGRSPRRMLAVQADIGVVGEADRIVTAVVERFGRLDVVVNNAARWDDAPLAETGDELILDALRINQFAPLALIRAALDQLRRDAGSVVNISSTGTRVPLPGNTVYAGTKAALEQMTRNLAVELGPDGIRVNAVAPGATDTEMLMPTLSDDAVRATVRRTPLRRIGTPDDIAPVVLFLASPEARWVTGQTIQAAGGLML